MRLSTLCLLGLVSACRAKGTPPQSTALKHDLGRAHNDVAHVDQPAR